MAHIAKLNHDLIPRLGEVYVPLLEASRFLFLTLVLWRSVCSVVGAPKILVSHACPLEGIDLGPPHDVRVWWWLGLRADFRQVDWKTKLAACFADFIF